MLLSLGMQQCLDAWDTEFHLQIRQAVTQASTWLAQSRGWSETQKRSRAVPHSGPEVWQS